MQAPFDPARDYRGFVRAHTAPAQPSLVPEVTLYLASEVTPLWQASEAWLALNNLNPPFWAFAWPGGQALARYALDNPDAVRGKSVFDLAAGSGVTALAAMVAGASRATAVEIDPFAMAAIALNAEINGVAIALLDGHDFDATMRAAAAHDVIFAGDVCYEKSMTEKIIPPLRELATKRPVLLADPGRAYLPQTGLEELARYTVPTSRDLEDRETRETVIYRLLPA